MNTQALIASPNNQFNNALDNCQELPSPLKVVRSDSDLSRVQKYRKEAFLKDYPELKDFSTDVHDTYSITLFTENTMGEITSTARLVFDSEHGLPADSYAKEGVDKRRKEGLKLLEVSRFSISDEAKSLHLLPVYYRAFYELCVDNGVDSMIIVINKKSVNFHRKRIGASTILDSIENIAGSKFQFTCMEWAVAKTKPQFLQWAGCLTETVSTASSGYTIQQWDSYSRFFASVYTQVQRELYQEALKYLSGSVIDLGCGPARMAPLLAENDKVLHYTGIEYAKEMVEIAEYTLSQLSRPAFRVLHKAVEDVEGKFTSAVSLQNYYACTNPVQVLLRVFDVLEPGAIFVIATPNPSLDQQKLFREAKSELMWHPDFAAFEEHNMQLAGNESAHFVTMNTLLQQLQAVGFIVEMCHQKHYDGGVNFVVCRKPNS